jgi:hypothetical protein
MLAGVALRGVLQGAPVSIAVTPLTVENGDFRCVTSPLILGYVKGARGKGIGGRAVKDAVD